MKTKLIVNWTTKDQATIKKIRDRFGIPGYTTVNGLSPAEISDEDMLLFIETAKRGFFRIINEKWCKNGEVFVFNSRK